MWFRQNKGWKKKKIYETMQAMKNFILAFLFPVFVLSASNPQKPPANVEEFRWLYEILFSSSDRQSEPAESFKSFYVHLLDSNQFFPHPEKIARLNLNSVVNIAGQITYVNVIKKMYTYDILQSNDGAFILNIRVHLKNPIGTDIESFASRLQAAQNLWNAGRVAADFNYSFKFDLAETEEAAHFSVTVMDSTRGPYDRSWGRNWSATTIAHEMGHMLGLGDEYQTISGQVDCLKSSIMCMSSSGIMQKHHYYFILRRLVNSASL